MLNDYCHRVSTHLQSINIIIIIIISKISSTCFGQSFAHLQECKNKIFKAYDIVSCKDGCTNSYVVLMWYPVLINVIVVGGCVVLSLGILLVFVF